ncbi:hypothetical protein UY3_13591 [Chelonia mydas]|uniref:Uncharacterized protein n=1 Tax=Chelonia mydas TaxID=8469 RepID=M7BAX5_CHEMY|nr:hypothetical protein UY3_13591 [Chelonia mydas]
MDTRMDPTRMDPTRMDPIRMDTTLMDTTRMDPTRMDTTRMDTHMDPRCPVDLDALPLLGVIPQVALMGIIKSRSIRSMAMVIMDTSQCQEPKQREQD